jgi:uncharacterized surface protein with fasciclin (FAS1) repeats
MNKATLAGIAAVVILGGGALVFLSRDNDSTESKDTTSKTSEQVTEKPAEKKVASDIVDLAIGTEQLSTLVTAVKAGDLVSTLKGDGPFTVFAPTNSAFAALPAGTLDTLLLPENKQTLAGILTYHVVSGKVMSSQLTDGQVIKTVQGQNLTVMIDGGKVMLKDAKGGMSTVTSADIDAKNGVVHVIDSVVMPL